jgi:hypothetical protein
MNHRADRRLGIMSEREERTMDSDELMVPNHPHADQRNWMPGDDDDGLPFDLPGGDAGWPPILTKETLDAVRADPQFRNFVLAAQIVVLARRQGAAIRVLARLLGESKSSMHRWLWLYEQIGSAALSQLGQDGETEPRIDGALDGASSQMGQDVAA